MATVPSTIQSYRERRPSAGLAPHVTCVWVQQVEAIAAAASPEAAAAVPLRTLLSVPAAFAGLIAGSTLLASAVPAAQRPRIEGAGELGMGIAAAGATAVAGPVVGLAGYATLAVAGSAAAAALAPFLVAVARRGLPREAPTANRLLG